MPATAIKYSIGYVMRGGREMENHFEVMWDLLHSIPSLETEGASVLDEYYWLNKADPNYSLCRATEKQGQDAHTDKKFGLSDKAAMEIMKLFFTPDEELEDKRITDFFDDEVLNSNFWLYWRTMFAFENWHSALEMKLYIKRYIHHIGGLPDFTALRFTRYNQYESIILPMIEYLKGFGVRFHYDTKVTDVKFDIQGSRKDGKLGHRGARRRGVQHRPDRERSGVHHQRRLRRELHRGCPGQGSRFRPHHQAGQRLGSVEEDRRTGPVLRPPEKFCSDPELSNWESATITTLDDKIPQYIQKICKRDPFSGHTVTGGIVTVKDSSWLLSWTLNRQQQFRDQPKDQLCVWVYGLFSDKPGDYVKKPMRDCTGKEICMEWLYHIGVPVGEIEELAEHSANTVPVMMPYITAFFMPRAMGDRPDIVPEGAVNFAFLGQFAETKRDTIFTTEYSMRTGMEAVYTLLNVDRGVPEVWGSTYDVRDLLNATVKLRDGKKITDMDLPLIPRLALKEALKKIEGTDLEKILKEYNAI